jgi:hypothetical protein
MIMVMAKETATAMLRVIATMVRVTNMTDNNRKDKQDRNGNNGK